MNWYDLLRGPSHHSGHRLDVRDDVPAASLRLPHRDGTGTLGPSSTPHFKVWEVKLLRIIINPSMVVTWIFGVGLVLFHVYAMQQGWSFLAQPWDVGEIGRRDLPQRLARLLGRGAKKVRRRRASEVREILAGRQRTVVSGRCYHGPRSHFGVRGALSSGVASA